MPLPTMTPVLYTSEVRKAVEGVLGRTDATWMLTLDRDTYRGVLIFDDTPNGDAIAALPNGHVGIVNDGASGPDISRAAAALDKIVVGGGQ